jgi:hypothetical protein
MLGNYEKYLMNVWGTARYLRFCYFKIVYYEENLNETLLTHYIQDITERYEQTLGTSFIYQNKATCVHQRVSRSISFVGCSGKSTFVISAHIVLGDRLVGPHVFLCHPTGFFFCDLPKLLKNVLLAVGAWMFYIHDGTLAHFSHAVLSVLNNTYRDWWITGRTHTSWLPHSLDWILWTLSAGTPKSSCVCSSCWQWRGLSPLRCGYLSHYLHQPWHL